MARGEGRRGAGVLLLVLLVAAGGGAYNYHRNFQAEQEVPRPYRSYSDADLRALIAAYEEARAAGAPERGDRAAADLPAGALLGDRIAAFERAREAGDARRRELESRGQHEAVLRELRHEEALRAELGSGLAMHLRRLLTI